MWNFLALRAGIAYPGYLRCQVCLVSLVPRLRGNRAHLRRRACAARLEVSER